MDDKIIQKENSIEKITVDKFTSELVIRTIINNSYDTIYFKDLDSKFVFIGKSQADKFGLKDSSEAIGKSDFDFFPLQHAKIAYEDEQRIIKTGIPMLGKVEKNVWPDGDVLWVSTTKYPFYDLNGNIIGTWGITRDISSQKEKENELNRLNEQLKEANERLEILSIKDSLSDLYNHRHCYEVIEKELDIYKRRLKKGINFTSSIIILDIDYFKKINDGYGHLTGDMVIKQISAIIKQSIRIADNAFRFGGDEFVILLQDTPLEEAKIVADKIRNIIKTSEFRHKDSKFNITSSMGVASFNEADNPNELLELADNRLYVSKLNGRDKVT